MEGPECLRLFNPESEISSLTLLSALQHHTRISPLIEPIKTTRRPLISKLSQVKDVNTYLDS